MIKELTQDLEMELYKFFMIHRCSVPYYYNHVEFKEWRKSFLEDYDYNGDVLFRDLKTYLLIKQNKIQGFIQYGLTNFTLSTRGKEFKEKYGIIRNFYVQKDIIVEDVNGLLEKSRVYFNENKIENTYAYFHYFGMSCFARQGKLHESEFYIENHLKRLGYLREHENKYYSKILSESQINPEEINFIYSNESQSIVFKKGKYKIGACELYFVPNSKICFLKQIYINNDFLHQGLGTKCMNKLCYELHSKGFEILEVDTTDDNIRAQKFYMKNGFTDLGKMRSYYIP